MTYEERLQNVTVLGAAGKMGSGILLLTALEMADLMLKPENKGKTFVLNAMDLSDEGLSGLMQYLRAQVLKVAEKKTVALRKFYHDRRDLIENSEVIEAPNVTTLRDQKTPFPAKPKDIPPKFIPTEVGKHSAGLINQSPT